MNVSFCGYIIYSLNSIAGLYKTVDRSCSRRDVGRRRVSLTSLFRWTTRRGTGGAEGIAHLTVNDRLRTPCFFFEILGFILGTAGFGLTFFKLINVHFKLYTLRLLMVLCLYNAYNTLQNLLYEHFFYSDFN